MKDTRLPCWVSMARMRSLRSICQCRIEQQLKTTLNRWAFRLSKLVEAAVHSLVACAHGWSSLVWCNAAPSLKFEQPTQLIKATVAAPSTFCQLTDSKAISPHTKNSSMQFDAELYELHVLTILGPEWFARNGTPSPQAKRSFEDKGALRMQNKLSTSA